MLLFPFSMPVFLPDPNLCCPVFLPALPSSLPRHPPHLSSIASGHWNGASDFFPFIGRRPRRQRRPFFAASSPSPFPFGVGPRGGECCFRGKSRGGAGKKMMFTHDHAAQCFFKEFGPRTLFLRWRIPPLLLASYLEVSPSFCKEQNIVLPR